MKNMIDEEKLFRVNMGFTYWSDNKNLILKDLQDPSNEGKVINMIDELGSDVISSPNPEKATYSKLLEIGEEEIAEKWIKPQIREVEY